MRPLTGNDVAKIRELTAELYQLAVEIGLDIEVDTHAGNKNIYASKIDLVRANGYRDTCDYHKLPGRINIKVDNDTNREYYTVTTDNQNEIGGKYFPVKGECDGHIAAVFEEVRDDTYTVGRRRTI